MKLILLFATLLTLIAAFHTSGVFAAGMQDDVNQAATIVQRFETISEGSIPAAVLRDAKGLAILTVTKAGFILSGRGGTGVVVARAGQGWSGPSAIGTGGVGIGPQIGAEVTETVMVLNTDAAIKAFSRGANVQLGADLSVAAGPLGRTVEAGITPMAAVYTYSRSQGLFAGVSLEGTVIASRDEENAKYYGSAVTPEQILAGHVTPPAGALGLQKVLAAADLRSCAIMMACK